MSDFKLKLRELISQFDDTTLGFVLDWADMDNNFINLKKNIISDSNFVTCYIKPRVRWFLKGLFMCVLD